MHPEFDPIAIWLGPFPVRWYGIMYLLAFISFLLLIPLVLTSPKIMLKKLGFKIWKRIHYLIYPAAIFASVHFYMLVRANKIEPAIYIFIIFLLLLYRLIYKVILPRRAR